MEVIFYALSGIKHLVTLIFLGWLICGHSLESIVHKTPYFPGASLSQTSECGMGTDPHTNEDFPIKLPISKPGEIEALLDNEAADLANKNVEQGALCCKKVKLLMIAPKTNSRPIKEPCCDFEAVVYWSPQDSVPNQRPRFFKDTESEKYWLEWGAVNTVDTRPMSPGGAFGNHDLSAFMGENPSYMGDRMTGSGFGKKRPGQCRRKRKPSGTSAPDPRSYVDKWSGDDSVDLIVVCHSQGCNNAMASINRGCTCQKGE